MTATPNPSPYFLPDVALESRNDNVVRGARQHGAADDDNVIGGFVAERRPNLLAHALEVGEVEAAVRPAGRADADQRHAAVANRLVRRRWSREGGPRRLSRAIRSPSPGSTIGLLPPLTCGDLVGVDIDADDLMPFGGQRGRRDAADIPETEDRDVHATTLVRLRQQALNTPPEALICSSTCYRPAPAVRDDDAESCRGTLDSACRCSV